MLLGVLIAVVMGYALEHVRAHACPPQTFIYGSTKLGSLLAAIPWLFVGLLGGSTLTLSIHHRWIRAKEGADRSTTLNRKSIRQLAKLTAAFLTLAIALYAYGVLVGFCASAQGINIKPTPWSPKVMYSWTEVTSITVNCQSLGRRHYYDFELAMRDGKIIDLYDMPRSFHRGYAALTDALRSVPLAYDDTGVRASCNSPLRDLSRQWPRGVR